MLSAETEGRERHVTQLEGMRAVSVPRTCNPLVGRHRSSPRAVEQKETMMGHTAFDK